jgi:serine/threonine protein kinase
MFHGRDRIQSFVLLLVGLGLLLWPGVDEPKRVLYAGISRCLQLQVLPIPIALSSFNERKNVVDPENLHLADSSTSTSGRNALMRAEVGQLSVGDALPPPPLQTYKLEKRLFYIGQRTPFYHSKGLKEKGMELVKVDNAQRSLADTHRLIIDKMSQTVATAILTRDGESIDPQDRSLSTQRAFESECTLRNGSFCLQNNIFRGGHGEIWKASHVDAKIDEVFILKRMRVSKPDIMRCALREIYFGEMFKQLGLRRTSTLLHFFTTESGEHTQSSKFESVTDYWLVFKDAGVSLQQLLYATIVNSQNVYFSPSAIWRKMKLSAHGSVFLREIMRELIKAVADLHDAGVLHRDIKPSNILLNVDHHNFSRPSSSFSGGQSGAHLVIADFSSAVCDEALRRGLYSWVGEGDKSESGHDHHSWGRDSGEPSIEEETLAYAPPEVTLQSCWRVQGDQVTPAGVLVPASSVDASSATSHSETALMVSSCKPIAYDMRHPFAYDSWSVGVVFLELVLGTGDVFRLDERSSAIVRQRLAKRHHRRTWASTVTQEEKDRAFKRDLERELMLEAMNTLCIRPSSDKSLVVEETTSSVVSCMQRAIQEKDALDVGLETKGVDLLSRLLAWEPERRISMREALKHEYLQ